MVTAAGERRKGRRKESLMAANAVVNLARTSPGEQPESCSKSVTVTLG